MEKVVFDLGTNAWHGFKTESVWATRLHDEVYRIENTPFFAKGVSFQDSVMTKLDGNQRFFADLVSSSGRSTYRILMLENEHNSAVFGDYWKPLERLGCSYEQGVFGYQLFAVDVPPSTNIEAVYSFLEHGERDGTWTFEEGHCGQPS